MTFPSSYFDCSKLSSSPLHTSQHSMPSISEDEPLHDSDDAADHPLRFAKTAPSLQRRGSMLTKALHTDSESHTESHDESLGFSTFRRQASRSSTCSTWSARSEPTTDEGHASNASSPSSRTLAFRKEDVSSEHGPSKKSPSPEKSSDSQSAGMVPAADKGIATSKSSDDAPVEEKLGRKRCISFACGGASKKPSEDKAQQDSKPPARSSTEPVTEQQKRPCMIKFACPSKISFAGLDKEKTANATAKASRHVSPPPRSRVKSPAPAPLSFRSHRDSDSTIKEESPKTARKVPPLEPRRSYLTAEEEDQPKGPQFSAFASKDQTVDDWVDEKTCHKSRLTVDDTLTKEKDLQQLGEEAEEEAQQEDLDDDDDDMHALDSDDDPISEGGFDTDDEEGFAESDDDDDGDSDYEWWAPRKSPTKFKPARLAPGDNIRPPALHADDDESYESSVSPKQSGFPNLTPRRKSRSKVEPVAIRPPTPELPDSTDFVCGTLDEDKPIEDAYASVIQQRKAARRAVRPQDIDPTFPTDIASDDEDEDAEESPAAKKDDSDAPHFMHGALENIDAISEREDEHRGRARDRDQPTRLSPPAVKATIVKRSPAPAPVGILSSQRHKSPMPPPSHAALQRRPKSPAPVKRVKSPLTPKPTAAPRARSPMPPVNTSAAAKAPAKKGQVLRSPPPRGMFSHSPRRHRSPLPPVRTVSPAPSRRGSPPDFKPMAFGTSFLGHRPSLTHTSSLPRSPHVFGQRRVPFENPMGESDSEPIADENDDGDDTAKENKTYERSAIDIVQGLERKRLRRRQKFFENYCRKEEKKAQRREKQQEKAQERQEKRGEKFDRRLQPGKGAQRMRQVGIECAIYRGKRVLSV